MEEERTRRVVGGLFRAWLIHLGKNQADVARSCSLTPNQISAYSRNENDPSTGNVLELAVGLGLWVDSASTTLSRFFAGPASAGTSARLSASEEGSRQETAQTKGVTPDDAPASISAGEWRAMKATMQELLAAVREQTERIETAIQGNAHRIEQVRDSITGDIGRVRTDLEGLRRQTQRRTRAH